jgi:hypothetical protein
MKLLILSELKCLLLPELLLFTASVTNETANASGAIVFTASGAIVFTASRAIVFTASRAMVFTWQ